MEQKIAYEPHPVSPERKAELRGQGFKIVDARFAPKGYLREDGPTVDEYVEAGYPAVNYPPAGYASRSTDEEIAQAVERQNGLSLAENSQRPDGAAQGEQVAGIDPAIQPPVAVELPVVDVLDSLDVDQLRALAKDRNVAVHHAAGADKIRAALRAAAE